VAIQHIRVLVCGKSWVGKSSIIKRFATNRFTSEMIGAAFQTTRVLLNGDIIALEIWDTAESEHSHSVIPSLLRNATAVVVIFDITSRPTLDSRESSLDDDVRRSRKGVQCDLISSLAEADHRTLKI
jgi:GTPase SAR1 family protein